MSPSRWRAEWTCLGEFARCTVRHPRYLVIALALYAAPLRPVLRYGFCFLQHVDDLLDGHLVCAGEPLERVDQLTAQLLSGMWDSSAIGNLAWFFWRDLAPESRAGVLALIEEMRLDRLRVRDRLLWDRQQLHHHLRRTFELSLDLLFLNTGADLRAADVPELVEVLGWCSTFRDLEDDLALGLVNVPADVMQAARGAPLQRCSEFVRWRDEECARAGRLLQ